MGIESFIQSVCVQRAVYWEPPMPDGYGGVKPQQPIEIPVRWTETGEVTAPSRSQGLTKANLEKINAEILSPNDVKQGGYLWLGTLADLEAAIWPESPATTPPASITGALEVKQFTKIPMIKSSTVFVRQIIV